MIKFFHDILVFKYLLTFNWHYDFRSKRHLMNQKCALGLGMYPPPSISKPRPIRSEYTIDFMGMVHPKEGGIQVLAV
jgi:hypothetical protein